MTTMGSTYLNKDIKKKKIRLNIKKMKKLCDQKVHMYPRSIV